MPTVQAKPDTQQQLAEAVREAAANVTPIDVVGGDTASNYGLPARGEGLELHVAGLNRLIDFPAADMTVTVEAGFIKGELDRVLAEKNLRLAIDVPHATSATLGGIVACNWNGPRRFGLGGIRDAVIGITAVDGRGDMFCGGGRVVKNVAGYDFCKLLTGSLGTLAVITELTFKLRPVSERLEWLVAEFADLAAAEPVLAASVSSGAELSAVEIFTRSATDQFADWGIELADNTVCVVAVAMEGNVTEVDWMTNQLRVEWRALSVERIHAVSDEHASQLLGVATDAAATSAPLVIRAHILPGCVVEFMQVLQGIESQVQVVAHAGDGVIDCSFNELPSDGGSKTIIGELQPLAQRCGGSVVMMANPDHVALTRRAVWGPRGAALEVMQAVKTGFDPDNLLNRGRFVFS